MPATLALAAEPLFVLVDTAVVGRLGTAELGGVAIAGALLSNVALLCIFLAYGTTSRAARLFGAGRREDAVREGVQASWLALLLGLAIVAVGQLASGPATGVLAGGREEVRAFAETWLRIAICGAPLILLSLAGVGWLRGIQDTRRPLAILYGANGLGALASPLLVYPAGLGVAGSALANVAGQALAVALFTRALVRERVPLRPVWPAIRGQLRIGRELVVRTLAMQCAFLSAAAVATRMGTATIAAHQIALQLWFFLALLLDGIAIAAQSVIGEQLGAGDARRARLTARRLAILGGAFGLLLGLLLAAGHDLLPRVFTDQARVLDEAAEAWPLFAAMQPAAGVLFAIDGILIGAGDMRFMRNVSMASALGVFVPATFTAYALDLGIRGIWLGLTGFVLARLVAGVARLRGGRWAIPGAMAP